MDKLLSVHFLLMSIVLGVIAPFPVQISDLIGWPDLGGGIAMAIQAERHRKRLIMIDFVHLIHGPMAFDAAYATVHMDGVIKVHEIRHPMNLNPRDGLAAGSALANQGQPRVVL